MCFTHETYCWSDGGLSTAPDPGLVFQASLTSAQVLLPGSQASLNSLLLEGHSLLVLAAVMFAPGGIDQVSTTCDPTSIQHASDLTKPVSPEARH